MLLALGLYYTTYIADTISKIVFPNYDVTGPVSRGFALVMKLNLENEEKRGDWVLITRSLLDRSGCGKMILSPCCLVSIRVGKMTI